MNTPPSIATTKAASTAAPRPAAASAVQCWALLPCAGTGSRAVAPGMPAAVPKQYQLVAGQPLVLHTLAAFAQVGRLHQTLVAVAPGDDFFVRRPSANYQVAPCGGATRAATVLGGLQVLRQLGAQEQDWVLVHDAARCLITPAEIEALIDACQHDSVGGLLAHKLADTLKTASDGPGGARVLATVDRTDKWLAQTPQMFRWGLLQRALHSLGSSATDEASAVEHLGMHPKLVPGGAHNFKVTYPQDFALAEAVLTQRGHGGTLDRFGGQRGQASSEPGTTIFFARPGAGR